MTRISWGGPGLRLFEAGVDQGVLYVAGESGVPWIGLIEIQDSSTGGAPKPRYIDGVKVSNHAGPEEFQGSIEAYMYPPSFENCIGILKYQNGLRVRQQQRKQFGLSYRTKIGNDVDGIDHAYKIHILYNLRAEPAEGTHSTIGEELEPMTFSWNISSRSVLLDGLRATASFELDSRDIPPVLMQTVEDILYGTATTEPMLPDPGLLVFLFDSFEDMAYDAGGPLSPVFSIHDAGMVSSPVTSTIDSGGV